MCLALSRVEEYSAGQLVSQLTNPESTGQGVTFLSPTLSYPQLSWELRG